jgi:poly(ADP-ribose) glycohydrolase ARH3
MSLHAIQPLRPDSERSFGCLLGLILADAIGARFEGLQTEQLHSAYKDRFAAFEYSAHRQSLRYTDDGQMALALAEYLAVHDSIVPNLLMQSFVDAYEPWRGYGRGARVIIEAFRDQADYEFVAQHLFPGGSLGNGAAMRSAPVGLRFMGDANRIWDEAKKSAWPTHRHELGIEGAQIIALATSIAATAESIDAKILSSSLLPYCKTVVFENRLSRLADLTNESQIAVLGNGIEAHESVVTALACFALHPTNFKDAISTAIWQGGDTDTISAMTGALVGARIGSTVSDRLDLNKLESGLPFIDHLRLLANELVCR